MQSDERKKREPVVLWLKSDVKILRLLRECAEWASISVIRSCFSNVHPTVYSALYRLKKSNLIEERNESNFSQPLSPRRYYRLSFQGAVELAIYENEQAQQHEQAVEVEDAIS